MTPREKKEAVRQVIVKAVPDILQLSRGCDVILYGVRQRFVKYDRNSFEFVTDKGEATLTSKELRERVEVIGRPIQLPDVLVAIEEKCQRRIKNSMGYDTERQYDANQGDEYTHNLKIAVLQTLSRYDLSQDFDHQSEAFYLFAWELFYE